MIKQKELENLSTMMDQVMKANGLMINNMVKVKKHGKMELFMLGNNIKNLNKKILIENLKLI